MGDALPLIICSHFRAEADLFIRESGLASRVDLKAYPARCHIAAATALVRGDVNAKVRATPLFPGGLCLRGLDDRQAACPRTGQKGGGDPGSDSQVADNPFTGNLVSDGLASGGLASGGCLSLVAPEWLLDNLVREGAYLVSPGWLASWRENVAAWGFDVAGLRAFAQESMRRICLLDTLVSDASEAQLAECAEAFGLPAMRIPVGMDHCSAQFRAVIAGRLVMDAVAVPCGQARPAAVIDTRPGLADTRSVAHAGQMVPVDPVSLGPRSDADYAMALDLLSQLDRFRTEQAVIGQILEILSMLFAPARLYLVSFRDGSPDGIWRPFMERESLDEATAIQCVAMAQVPHITEHGTGFALPLDFDNRRLAIVFLSDFAMPDGKPAYRDLMEAIAPILSLSLNNARNYETVLLDEAALQAQHAELAATLEFRNRLLAIIGHDLRGPISSMDSVLGFIIDGLRGKIPDREMCYLEELAKAVRGTYALLSSLLEWANLQNPALKPEPRTVVLRQLVDTILELMHGQAASKQVRLLNMVDPRELILADSNIVQTIVRNLVSNALKFTAADGAVTIRASRAAGLLRIDVVDCGTGMDADTLRQLFDFSKRASRPGTAGERGSGFGLVFCRELAEKIGARLLIESTPGIGTQASLVFDDPVLPSV
jgi:signal transduction histidine kinase